MINLANLFLKVDFGQILAPPTPTPVKAYKKRLVVYRVKDFIENSPFL
jgi:hypothetical protein